MTKEQSRRAGRVVGMVGAFSGMVLGLLSAATPKPAVAAPLAAQKDEKKDAKPAFPMPTEAVRLAGTFECKGCHNVTAAEAKQNYQETQGYEFIRLGENRVWGVYDLHSQALENLKAAKNETAKRMEENLKKYHGEKYSNITDTACLACHASVRVPINTEVPRKERKDALYPDQWDVKSFAINEGVGCEMCHGHGNAYLSKHKASEDVPDAKPGEPTRVVPWREWDPKVKTAWGLTDLRDPAELVKRCASCHVGNVQEGRFVTHEMYAVGHPPLPPFDAMAYMREQPRHWGLPRELPFLTKLADTDKKKAWDVFQYRKESEEVYIARRFAVASIATLRESAQLLAQQAAVALKQEDGLDFATFDCYACHHDLKVPSDRQIRGFGAGKPGRVLLRPTVFTLARAVVGHAGTMQRIEKPKHPKNELVGADVALDAAAVELAHAFKKKSLGDPKLIAVAVEKIVSWSDNMIAQLDDVRYTRAETVRLAQSLGKTASGPIADPEAAQILAWGVETLYFELRDTTAAKEPPAIEKDLSHLDGLIVRRLRPNLPFLPGEPVLPPDPDKEPMAVAKIRAEALIPVSTRIGPRLKILNGFQSQGFRDVFGKLDPLLGEMK